MVIVFFLLFFYAHEWRGKNQSGEMPARKKDRRGSLHDVHFQHLPLPDYELDRDQANVPSGRFTPYDPEVAQDKRMRMCTTPEGAIMDVTKMDAKEIADSIEMRVPLVRPYGCGPVAASDEVVLRTYDRIIEVRDEVRFTDRGLAVGDRTFKRCYHQARRAVARYDFASPALRRAADDAGLKGVHFVYTQTISTRRVGDKEIRYPEIRKADENEIPDGVLRQPKYAVLKHFEYLNNNPWHRYLFPFGCFFWEKPADSHKGWKEWNSSLLTPPSKSDVRINPYSVSTVDILYLCNTDGYLERFVFVIGVIHWAKCWGVDLLRYHKKPSVKTDADFRSFVTLERYLHFFGSIHLHKKVIEETNSAIGGHWTKMVEMLDHLETKCCQEFNVPKHSLNGDFDNMTVKKNVKNLSSLVQVFPACTILGKTK